MLYQGLEQGRGESNRLHKPVQIKIFFVVVVAPYTPAGVAGYFPLVDPGNGAVLCSGMEKFGIAAAYHGRRAFVRRRGIENLVGIIVGRTAIIIPDPPQLVAVGIGLGVVGVAGIFCRWVRPGSR
jgi:hypothetical protein